jgi:hypothetical protein
MLRILTQLVMPVPSMSDPCRFCGVLPEYGHSDWRKVDRAPTGQEVAAAVVEEHDHSVGYDGPSSGLAGMARAYLDAGAAK